MVSSIFKKINKDTMSIFMGKLLQAFISIVSIKVTTYYLSIEELGIVYLLSSISGFFMLFLFGPFNNFVNRHTNRWHSTSSIGNKFIIINYYFLSIATISIPITFILYNFGVANTISFTTLSIFITVAIFFSSWNQTIIPMLNMLGKTNSFVAFTVLTQSIALLFSFILIKVFEPTGINWLYGQIISSITITLIAFIYFFTKFHIKIDINSAHKIVNLMTVKNAYVFMIPFGISTLFLWMQIQSYPIIIEQLVGSEYLGYLGLGFGIAATISAMFESIIQQQLFPKLYSSMDQHEVMFKPVLFKTFDISLSLYIYLAIYVSFLAPFLFQILSSKHYEVVIYFIIFGIWTFCFRMCASMLSQVAIAKHKTQLLLIPYFVGAMISIFGVYFACNSLNYNYIIPSILVLSSFITFIIMYFLMTRIIKYEFSFVLIVYVFKFTLPLFIIPFYWYLSDNTISSIFVVLFSGLYFLFSVVKIINQIRKKYE